VLGSTLQPNHHGGRRDPDRHLDAL
jgi:hypothetical protein